MSCEGDGGADSGVDGDSDEQGYEPALQLVGLKMAGDAAADEDAAEAGDAEGDDDGPVEGLSDFLCKWS